MQPEGPFCQSCGMPLSNDMLFGTEADGSKNATYCVYCYKDGAFTQPDATLEQMIELSAKGSDHPVWTGENPDGADLASPGTLASRRVRSDPPTVSKTSCHWAPNPHVVEKDVRVNVESIHYPTIGICGVSCRLCPRHHTELTACLRGSRGTPPADETPFDDARGF